MLVRQSEDKCMFCNLSAVSEVTTVYASKYIYFVSVT